MIRPTPRPPSSFFLTAGAPAGPAGLAAVPGLAAAAPPVLAAAPLVSAGLVSAGLASALAPGLVAVAGAALVSTALPAAARGSATGIASTLVAASSPALACASARPGSVTLVGLRRPLPASLEPGTTGGCSAALLALAAAGAATLATAAAAAVGTAGGTSAAGTAGGSSSSAITGTKSSPESGISGNAGAAAPACNAGGAPAASSFGNCGGSPAASASDLPPCASSLTRSSIIAADSSRVCARRGDLRLAGSASAGLFSSARRSWKGATSRTGVHAPKPLRQTRSSAFRRPAPMCSMTSPSVSGPTCLPSMPANQTRWGVVAAVSGSSIWNGSVVRPRSSSVAMPRTRISALQRLQPILKTLFLPWTFSSGMR